MPRPSFAYLFERFPSFTQTFTVREVQGVAARGLPPRVYSIRRPEGEPPQDFPSAIREIVRYLPETSEMREEIRRLKDEKKLPKPVAKALRQLNESGDTADKTRFYEAAWLGLRLREEGIHHVHVHFAGIAARTAYWMKQLYGIAFSVTAHANDFFVKGDYKITLEDLVREAAFIVHVSDYGRAEMADVFPKWAGKMLTVYNGLDLNDYALPEGVRPAEPPLILSVGRLIEKKGFADLIAACALLRDQGLHFQCAIAGDGPLHEALADQITRAGLGNQVRLLGNQPQAEIRRLLAACRCFALACATEPDGGKDNLPTVITEAMAFAKPTVSTTLAGVPEQVIHGQTGLLSAPGDVPALAANLAQLLRDEHTAFGQAALARAKTHFALEVTSARLADVLVTRGKARPTGAQLLRRPWLIFRG
jgi:colanic acid/amylovoran biosynthesis glycosyltransferase